MSVEIPIDVQSALVEMPPAEELRPLPPSPLPLDGAALDAIAGELAAARRPLLWLGGGARGAAAQARRFADAGWGVISSVNGRGVVPEDHPASLGAFTTAAPVERLYGSCDAMLVVGSRLRGNETLKYRLPLPRPLYQIDADPAARNRSYPVCRFAAGDAADALDVLAARLLGTIRIDPGFADDVAATRHEAEAELRSALGPYAALVDALRAWFPDDAPWVRDVTVSNSMWGNRSMTLRSPRAGVHALGGGIGQGLPMAIGGALAAPDRKTVALTGDGGLTLCLGELATLAQERANVLLIVMNDGGYGVIRNIQDAQFGGRHYLANLQTPEFGLIARALGLAATRVGDAPSFASALERLGATPGPAILEVDMAAFGSFAKAFAGPPVREAARA